MKHNLLRRGIKLVDIGYVTFIYFALAFVVASGLNRFYGEFDIAKENTKTHTRIVLELIGMLWLNGILIYLARNIVPLIPFPLDKLYGFKHSLVKELSSAAIFVYFLMFFQQPLLDKARNYYKVINDTKRIGSLHSD